MYTKLSPTRERGTTNFGSHISQLIETLHGIRHAGDEITMKNLVKVFRGAEEEKLLKRYCQSVGWGCGKLLFTQSAANCISTAASVMGRNGQ